MKYIADVEEWAEMNNVKITAEKLAEVVESKYMNFLKSMSDEKLEKYLGKDKIKSLISRGLPKPKIAPKTASSIAEVAKPNVPGAAVKKFTTSDWKRPF